jgi:calcineurin-like phosphoesterase
MCGPDDSILGRRIEPIIERMLTSTPKMMPVAKGPVRLCGVLIDIEVSSGRALRIERLSELSEPEPDPQAAIPAEDSAELS